MELVRLCDEIFEIIRFFSFFLVGLEVRFNLAFLYRIEKKKRNEINVEKFKMNSVK